MHNEPYPGFAAEQAAHEQRGRAIAEAGIKPLPGPLRAAFAAEPVTLHGFTLQPVTAGLIAVLTRIESPLLDIVRIYRRHAAAMGDATTPEARAAVEQQIAADIAKEVTGDPEAMVETVWCFLQPPPKLRAALAKGRPAFREEAMARLADTLNPVHLAELERACGQHFANAFASALQYQTPAPEGTTVFRTPPAEPVTASAGGSTSLPA